MQNIIILDADNDRVIVQAQEKVYMDTINNFFIDYGKDIEYKSIDYNCGTQSCWLNGEAFQAYPNTVCEDILNSIDTLLKKKAEREYIEPTLDELKTQKLELVDAWTERKITGGFTSECTGELVCHDSDKDTQLTMQGIALNVNTDRFAVEYPTGCPVRGYADRSADKTIFYLTPEQVLEWCADLSTHIGTCKQAGWNKQAEVNAAQSKEELDAIILD